MSVRRVLIFSVLATLAASFELPAQTPLILPAGTPVRLHTVQVTEDIQTSGVVVIPLGTVVFATVTEVHSQAQGAKGGLLKLKLTNATLKNGVQVPLVLQPAGQSQTVTAAIAGAYGDESDCYGWLVAAHRCCRWK